MNAWTVIESYVRLDANGHVHNVSQRENDGKVEWVLSISKTSQEHTFSNAEAAKQFSAMWEDKKTAELAEEAAEAAKWPKMGTKTMRRFRWDANKMVELELKKYQPKFGHQKVGIYLNGEYIGATEQTMDPGYKEPWRYVAPGEERSPHWRKYSTQADAIRCLLGAYEKKTGKFL